MDKKHAGRFASEKVGEMKRLVSEQSRALAEFRELHKDNHGCPASRIVQALFDLFDKEVTLNEILKSDLANSYPAREILQFFADLSEIFGVHFGDLSELTEFLREYVRDFEAACAKTNESESLNAELMELRKRNSELEMELQAEREANKELDALNQKLLRKVESIKTKKGEIGKVREQRNRLRQDVREFHAQLDQIEGDIKRDLEMSLSEERRKVERMKDECLALEQKRKAGEYRYLAAQEKLMTLQDKTKLLEATTKKLMWEKEECEDRLNTTNECLKLLQRTNSQLESKLERKRARLRTLKSDLALAKETSVSSRATLSSTSDRVKALEAKCLESEKRIAMLQTEVDSLRSANQVLKTEIQKQPKGDCVEHNGDALKEHLEQVDMEYLTTIDNLQRDSAAQARAFHEKIAMLEEQNQRLAASKRGSHLEEHTSESEPMLSETSSNSERQSWSNCCPHSLLFGKLKRKIEQTKKIAQSSSESCASSERPMDSIMDDISAIHREMDLLAHDIEKA